MDTCGRAREDRGVGWTEERRELATGATREAGASGRSEPPSGARQIDTALRDRLRAVVCCLALTCLATSTRPGQILADTKIDMPVNPLAFLGRALHLWDPEQFGQLQNQAVGYLFPMGPVYVLGDLVALPAWITQRLWLAMLLCAAFLGARRLAVRLGVGGPVGGLVAGLVYALAPTGLASLGQISSDYLPFAMAPWIVLPLITAVHDLPVRGRRGRLIVKAVARSGLAVACCGGINATATAAVLVMPLIYLLTRPRGTPRLRVLACWSVSVALATCWWLIPLLLTAKYGFSWLTYTEKAMTTTGPTGIVTVLRGAERWVGYLVLDGQAWWPVGHVLSLSTLPVLCTGVAAALGLAGLVRAGLPERVFLLITLLAGLTIITAGHISVIESPLAAPIREILDGPLAPLRNLHRFDTAVRLPIALGAAHLISSVRRPQPRLRTLAVAFTALAGITLAAVGNGLSGPGDFREPPKYWRDAATWLAGRAGGQGVLAVPGSPFGDYLWGRPMDDIMQPLFTSRWAVRQLVPVGSPGYTRALDAIDQQVTAGRRSPGLSQFLSRMGVRYVLVRNDLRREGLRGAWPALLHQALDRSPGLRRVASFGTEPVGWAHPDDAVGAFDQLYPPLEVYEVTAAEQNTGIGAGSAEAAAVTSEGSAVTLADACTGRRSRC
jgi:arabinofuranan 3-O-arabinosyltransferase